MAASNRARGLGPDEVLEFDRVFEAPLALVWKMWREPEHMVRWYGPEGYWLTHCELDFRVGGTWKRCMSRAADHAHWIRGEYLEIVEPTRLVFTYINDYDEHEMVVSLDFAERGGRTHMHFHQAPFVTVAERDSHGWGWHSSLDLLADYVVHVAAADGAPVGRPRIEGDAADLVALRKTREKT